MKIPRVVIAGTSSGVGKTSVACGVIHALAKKGYTVSPFKAGPDYIDSIYLSKIAGRPAHNLDVWLMGQERLLASFTSHCDADAAVIEGVMGFYDGHSGDTDHSSTHHVAAITRSPVILVLDASKAARSVAASALGFKKFHKNSRIVGVILNKIGSKRHGQLCRQALEQAGVPLVGIIPRADAGLESRHMGLVSTDPELKGLEAVSEAVSEGIDIDRIIEMMNSAPELPECKMQVRKERTTSIGVALDASFNFYYKDNLDALEHQGATLKFFSPVKDSRLPDCDGLYIGGGFPEVLAGRLEKNGQIMAAIKKAAQDGMPIYAECGGLMYLTRSITDGKKKFKMVGLYDAQTAMTEKMTLHYTEGEMSPCLLAERPVAFRGHEFHYSRLDVSDDARFAYHIKTGDGITGSKDGLVQHNTLASYCHLYFGPKQAQNMVQSCMKFSKR